MKLSRLTGLIADTLCSDMSDISSSDISKINFPQLHKLFSSDFLFCFNTFANWIYVIRFGIFAKQTLYFAVNKLFNKNQKRGIIENKKLGELEIRIEYF